MNLVTHPLGSADISIFSPEISKFYFIKKYRYRLLFWYIISYSFNVFGIFNKFFNEHGYNFDNVRKSGYFKNKSILK